MIWIVSSSVAGTDENLSARHEYIELVSQAHVSPWQKHVAEADRDGYIKPIVEYYQCRSENGEYGIVLTAHIDNAAFQLKNPNECRILENHLGNEVLTPGTSCIHSHIKDI